MIIGYFVIHFIPPVHVRVFVGIGVVFECVQFVGLIACIQPVKCQCRVEAVSVCVGIGKFWFTELATNTVLVFGGYFQLVIVSAFSSDEYDAISASHPIKGGCHSIFQNLDRSDFRIADVG